MAGDCHSYSDLYLYPKPVDFRKSIDGLTALAVIDDVDEEVVAPVKRRGRAPCTIQFVMTAMLVQPVYL